MSKKGSSLARFCAQLGNNKDGVRGLLFWILSPRTVQSRSICMADPTKCAPLRRVNIESHSESLMDFLVGLVVYEVTMMARLLYWPGLKLVGTWTLNLWLTLRWTFCLVLSFFFDSTFCYSFLMIVWYRLCIWLGCKWLGVRDTVICFEADEYDSNAGGTLVVISFGLSQFSLSQATLSSLD